MLSKYRFPLVERAVADVPALADPEFASGIRKHAQNLLQRSRGISGTLLSLISGNDCDDDCRSFVLFFDRIIVDEDVSPNHHAIARDRGERERWTGTSLHEEPESRGDERMKTEDRICDK